MNLEDQIESLDYLIELTRQLHDCPIDSRQIEIGGLLLGLQLSDYRIGNAVIALALERLAKMLGALVSSRISLGKECRKAIADTYFRLEDWRRVSEVLRRLDSVKFLP